MTRDEFEFDYVTLRTAGLDHNQIAERLGVERDSLMRRLRRHGIEYIPESAERSYLAALEQLIASGREFTSSDIPVEPVNRSHAAGTMRRALTDGRVEIVGKTRGRFDSHPRFLYRGIAQDRSVAS